MTASGEFGSFLSQEIAALREEINKLKGERVTYLQVEVTSVDAGNSTFGAAIPDAETGGTVNLTGIASPAQFLPTVGDTVTLALSGAQLVYQPLRIAPASVTGTEIAPDAVGTDQLAPASVTSIQLGTGVVAEENLSFNLADFTGSYVYYDSTEPTVPNGDDFHAGDLWLQDTGSTGPDGQPLYLTHRWDGSQWILLQDQGISDALAEALAAQSAAADASALADAAQATADSKIEVFFQATAPTSGMNAGDLWVDSDDNSLHRFNGSSWVAIQDAGISTALNGAATAQATADGKMTIYAQAGAPATANPGDLWIDTDNGNAVSVWQSSTTAFRKNWANNPSFEFDASGTVSSVTNWTSYSSGSNGTVTRSIVTTPGVADRNKAAKSSASSQAATAGTGHGYQQVMSATAGDAVRISASATVVTTGSNFVPYILLEWLNASNAVISSINTSGSGTVTTAQTLTVSGTAPANTVNARVTLMRRTAATTGSALGTSGVIFDAVLFEKNRSANAQTGYFDGASGGEAAWDGNAEISTSHTYQEGTTGTPGWQPRLLRTAAFQPSSIIARDVIATGTVSAALLEAVIVLADQSVVAGDVNADHSVLDQNGFHVFQLDPDAQVVEVGRLGTGANDFLGIGDDTGHLVAAIDDAGVASFSGLVVTDDPLIQGESLAEAMNRASGSGGLGTSNPGAAHWYGYADGTVANVDANEIGLVELPVWLDNRRMYMIWAEVCWHPQGIPCSLFMRVRDGGSSAPLMTSPTVLYRQHTGVTLNYDEVSQSGGLWQPTTTGLHRLLLTAQAYVSGSGLVVTDVSGQPAVVVLDLGPARALDATVNHATGGGGAGAPAPTQQYYVDLAPTSYVSRRGNGTLRTDTTDVVQGWDPSGFNGDGYGYWTFTLPSISGSIDRIDMYVYVNHTYFNSGGTAIWNVIHSGIDNPESSFEALKMESDGPVGGYPKPGGKTLTLPAGWYVPFLSASSPRAVGTSVGNSDGTNETYYIRFDGPSARLRIWYTQ